MTDAQTNNDAATRVALVTGGSRGIGAATARRLAADGFAVLVNYAGRADKAKDVVATIRQAGGHAVAVQGDVSVPADVARLFDAAEAEFGGLDVLVNSAGVIELAPIGEMSDADFDRIVASISRARSTPCARPRGDCGGVGGSSICPPA